MDKRTPSDFLKRVIGKPVVVKLNSGINYRGKTCDDQHKTGVLVCLDGYMVTFLDSPKNIALEQTEEYVDGQLKNKYGDTFVRGNNGFLTLLNDLVLYISAAK